MSNPIVEGTKQLAQSLDDAREAGKSLTKSIENIQHDGIEVAQQELESLKLKIRLKKNLNPSTVKKSGIRYLN